ncbi:hypothetical protein ACO0LB_10135 [Undibacterium sp. SXout7W]|uniref:hypothetical protein n=1 Tax=Undibacterium sp. SXout7W TaxID=3413049 RepID=UPI003BF34177
MNTSTRNFPITMLLNEEEFNDFKSTCKQADVKHSAQLRTLSLAWMYRQKNGSRQKRRTEYTGRTQNVSIPAKGGKGIFHVRL